MVQVHKYVYVLVFLLMLTAAGFAQDSSVEQKGIAVFVEKRCYTCHTVKAEAAKIDEAKAAFAKSKGVEVKESGEEKEEAKGGDLSNIGADKDTKWLSEFLKNPKDYFKDTAECKKLAKKKERKKFKGTDAEFQDLIAWLGTLKFGNQQEPGFEQCLKEE
ncbi:MAG TPA: c-type cytochrome [Thermodesulfobacteriota bacterium]|nr:c-type cytochrome [Thermodesulfobacteriota bacterium]